MSSDFRHPVLRVVLKISRDYFLQWRHLRDLHRGDRTTGLTAAGTAFCGFNHLDALRTLKYEASYETFRILRILSAVLVLRLIWRVWILA